MPTTAEILARAKAHQRAGQWRDAEQLYRAVLASAGDDVEALHGLGRVLAQQQDLDAAISSLERAARLRPDAVEIASDLRNAQAARDTNQGMALADADRLDEAAECYRRALAAQPVYVPALGNLGNVLRRQGKLDEAADSFHRALQLQPNFAQPHNDLGMIACQQGRYDEAIASYRRALELKPDFAEVFLNLASVFEKLDRKSDAAACYRRAVQLRPNVAQWHHGLGTTLVHQGRLDDAIASFRRALKLQPGFAEAWHSLGRAMIDQDRLEEAAECYARAVELEPKSIEAHHNLGITLAKAGRFDEAMISHRRALELGPENATAHIALGGTLMIQGQMAEGLREYEWRFRFPEYPPLPTAWKMWEGEPLAGRTLVLCSEQGLGDTLQFIRYAPLVRAQAAGVIVRCSARLHPLLARCQGVDQFITPEEPPPAADFFVPMMSLAWRLGTSLEAIPADIPYLFADDALLDAWRTRLGGIEGFKVGIVWHGSTVGDRGRSIPLSQFAPLAAVPGVRLVNLQKGPGLEELSAVADNWRILDFSDEVDTATGSFMDTAAIMKNLDLVITADSAPAHLAGALGVPVWLALKKVPEWRWLMGRQDSPWYPTMRLFRQQQAGDWQPVFQAIRDELAKVVKG